MSLFDWAKGVVDSYHGIDPASRQVRMPTEMEVFGNDRNTGGKGMSGPWTYEQELRQQDADKADRNREYVEAMKAYDARQGRLGLAKGLGALGAGLKAQGTWEGTTNPFGGSDAMIRGVDAFTKAITADERSALEKEFEADIQKLMMRQGLTRQQAITQLRSDAKYARLLGLRDATADVEAKEAGVDKAKLDLLPESEQAIINEANIYIRQGTSREEAIKKAAQNQGKDLSVERYDTLLDVYIKYKGEGRAQAQEQRNQAQEKRDQEDHDNKWLATLPPEMQAEYNVLLQTGTREQAQSSLVRRLGEIISKEQYDALPKNMQEAYNRARAIQQSGQDNRPFNAIWRDEIAKDVNLTDILQQTEQLTAQNALTEIQKTPQEKSAEVYNAKVRQLVLDIGGNPDHPGDVQKARDMIRDKTLQEYQKKYNKPDFTGEAKNRYNLAFSQSMVDQNKNGTQSPDLANVAGLKEVAQYYKEKGELDKANKLLAEAEKEQIRVDTQIKTASKNAFVESAKVAWENINKKYGLGLTPEQIKKRAEAGGTHRMTRFGKPSLENAHNKQYQKVQEEQEGFEQSVNRFQQRDFLLLDGDITTGFAQDYIDKTKSALNLLGFDFNLNTNELFAKKGMEATLAVLKATFGGSQITDTEREALLLTMGDIKDQWGTLFIHNKMLELNSLAGAEIKKEIRERMDATGLTTLPVNETENIKDYVWAKYKPLIQDAIALAKDNTLRSNLQTVSRAQKDLQSNDPELRAKAKAYLNNPAMSKYVNLVNN